MVIHERDSFGKFEKTIALQIRQFIGQELITCFAEQMARLCDLFTDQIHKSMNDFYDYLRNKIDVSKSTHCSYQQYYNL